MTEDEVDYFQYGQDFTRELPSVYYYREPSVRLPLEKAVRVFPELLVPWHFDDDSIEPDFILSRDRRVKMQYLYAAKQIFQRYFAEVARNNPQDSMLTSLEPLSWPTPGPIKGLTMLYMEISVLISLLQHSLSRTHSNIWRRMTDGLLSQADLHLYCEWLLVHNVTTLFDYANELQRVLGQYLLSEEGKYGRALESFHRGVWQGRVPSSHLPLQPDSLSKMTYLSAHPEQPLELQYLYTASQLFQESLYETSGIFFNIFFLKCLGAESELSCRNQCFNATKIPPSSWNY